MMQLLQDMIHSMLMCVMRYDPFASNLDIDENRNWLDYPKIFNKPYSSFTVLNLSLFNPNSPSHTDSNTN